MKSLTSKKQFAEEWMNNFYDVQMGSSTFYQGCALPARRRSTGQFLVQEGGRLTRRFPPGEDPFGQTSLRQVEPSPEKMLNLPFAHRDIFIAKEFGEELRTITFHIRREWYKKADLPSWLKDLSEDENGYS